MKKFILSVLAVVLLTPVVAGARGEFTIDPIDPGVRPVRPVCGNGIQEAGESCDDGNIVDGDGCSLSCQTETPQQTCSALFTNRLDVRCCIQHLHAGEKPEACPLPPPPPETQPGSDPGPVPSDDACASIDDPALRDCCDRHGGLSLDAIEECIPDGDDPSDACNLIVTIGGDVNGQRNVCCNYVNNDGIIQDSEVVQECKNSFSGQTSGDPVPGTGIPEGSEIAGKGFSSEETAGIQAKGGSGGCSLARGTGRNMYSDGCAFMVAITAAFLINRRSRRSPY